MVLDQLEQHQPFLIKARLSASVNSASNGSIAVFCCDKTGANIIWSSGYPTCKSAIKLGTCFRSFGDIPEMALSGGTAPAASSSDTVAAA